MAVPQKQAHAQIFHLCAILECIALGRSQKRNQRKDLEQWLSMLVVTPVGVKPRFQRGHIADIYMLYNSSTITDMQKQ